MSVDQKVRENVRLVYQVINDLVYIPDGVDREDLEQIGKIALWQAIEDYDESCGYKMSTCCYKAIYRDIIAYLRRVQRKKRNGHLYDSGVEDDFTNDILNSCILAEVEDALPESSYRVFYDKVIAGMTYDDLVKKYNLSKRKLRSIVDESKQLLRDNINWEEYIL